MPFPAEFIAKTFVKIGIECSKPLTQMKLQKVVYFAHGLHLASDLGPLINEPFQAWKFGPVVPQIYRAFKIFGSSPIDYSYEYFSNNIFSDYILSKESLDLITSTWENLKNADALKLSAWTHEKDSPWSAYYDEESPNKVIPNEVIETYFKKKFIAPVIENAS